MARPPKDADAGHLQGGRIDPAKVDLAKRPKRRRKARNRPDPAPELKDWQKAAQRRIEARPFPPNVMLEPAGLDEENWTAPHSDHDLWMMQIAECFGTRSRAAMVLFMRQLEQLCARDYWDESAQQWRLDEHEYSATLALINGLKPRNESEAALAAQLVALHLMAMKLSARAIRHLGDNNTALAAARVSRTYGQQLETYHRLRKPNRTVKQSIKVEKHLHQSVHYYQHPGGHTEEHDRPQGRKATIVDQRSPVQRDGESDGLPVSLPGDEGAARLPRARRKVTRRENGAT